MRRWLGWLLVAIVLMPVVLLAVVLGAINTGPGQRFVASEAGALSGGMVRLDGLSGGLPGGPRLRRIELRDATGPWLVIEDAALDFSPLALLSGTARIDALTARHVQVTRLPVSSGSSGSSSGGSGLPVAVDLKHLHIDRIDVGAAVAGRPLAISIDGRAIVASLQDAAADVTVAGLDAPGSLHLAGKVDPATLHLAVTHDEPAHGLLASFAGLPDLGALSLKLGLDGPWSRAATTLAATAGPLRADAHGTLDLTGHAADLAIAVHAPAMAPAPGISFDAVALDAQVGGPFAAPTGTGKLAIDNLVAAGAAVHRLDADLYGDKGRAGLAAHLDGLRVPGPRPDLFEADPLTLTVDAVLSDASLPVAFALSHHLLSLRGVAHARPALGVQAHVDVPDLAPLAAVGQVDIRGNTALDLKASQDAAGAIDATVAGTLGIVGGIAPAPALIGPDGRIELVTHVAGQDVMLRKLDVRGRALTVAASGTFVAQRLDTTADIALSDLHAVAPTVSGDATLHAHATGTTDDLALDADLAGDVATTGVPKGHVTAQVRATGLPSTPAGHVGADGTLDGAPVTLSADVARDAAATRVTIDRADWKSAHAEGALTLAAGAIVPTGHIALRMARLDELRRVTGQALTGAIDLLVDIAGADHPVATAKLRVLKAGIPGSSVALATLDAKIDDPAKLGRVDATLVATGIVAPGIAADARATVAGPREALAIAADIRARQLAGGPATLRARAVLDVPGQSVAVSELTATARQNTAQLLAPARIKFGSEISVDRLRLGLRQAVLEVAGRASPTLDLTARLSNVTADLARIADPTLQADGTLAADARLTGTPAAPQGTVHLDARGLRLRSGTAASLPPASILANATLRGTTAQLDVRLAAGRNTLAVTGTAPTAATGAMDLRAVGAVDLTALDPILAASGRRARGQLAVDAGVTGTLAAPNAVGSARLTGGEFQDFAQGARLDHIEAQVDAAGQTVTLTSLTARAGTGTLRANGTVGLGGSRPVDLHLTMAGARPLSSDLLTAVLDADLSLRGQLAGRLDASGTVTVTRADIRVPDKLPASVAVLDIRHPGQQPPAPAAPGPDIGLNLDIRAPQQVFVRGRGLDAELSGDLRVTGTAAAPRPEGGFTMRRGDISVAGQTLTFATGKVGFDGSGKIDPTLDFVANNTTAGVVATLQVTGYASDPKVVLSSVPQLPQDEVLAHLLFGQSAASLGPFQLASIAAALAQLTGVAGGGFDPLGSVRQGLGLDRLSVGGGTGGSGAAVQAGKYVARGVYVGAKQATSGGGTQATVQIDITKGLKLESSVGTGGGSAQGSSADSSNGTNVGVTYQFEY